MTVHRKCKPNKPQSQVINTQIENVDQKLGQDDSLFVLSAEPSKVNTAIYTSYIGRKKKQCIEEKESVKEKRK